MTLEATQEFKVHGCDKDYYWMRGVFLVATLKKSSSCSVIWQSVIHARPICIMFFLLWSSIMRNRSCLFYFPFSFHFSVLSTYTEKDAGASLHISPVIKPDFYILHLAADCTGLMVASMGPFPEWLRIYGSYSLIWNKTLPNLGLRP